MRRQLREALGDGNDSLKRDVAVRVVDVAGTWAQFGVDLVDDPRGDFTRIHVKHRCKRVRVIDVSTHDVAQTVDEERVGDVVGRTSQLRRPASGIAFERLDDVYEQRWQAFGVLIHGRGEAVNGVEPAVCGRIRREFDNDFTLIKLADPELSQDGG